MPEQVKTHPEITWNESLQQWECTFPDGEVVRAYTKDLLEDVLDYLEERR